MSLKRGHSHHLVCSSPGSPSQSSSWSYYSFSLCQISIFHIFSILTPKTQQSKGHYNYDALASKNVTKFCSELCFKTCRYFVFVVYIQDFPGTRSLKSCDLTARVFRECSGELSSAQVYGLSGTLEILHFLMHGAINIVLFIFTVIGHFRVPKTLTMKTRLSVKPFL